MRSTRRHGDSGFSLLVLLVAVVIVGLVITVVIIGLRASDPKPSVVDCSKDRSALLQAEEAFHTKQGRYGTESELVDAGLITGSSSQHDVILSNGFYTIVDAGGCAEVAASNSGPATVHLAIGAVPDTVTAGRIIAPAITVTLTDDAGAVLEAQTADVTISLDAPNGATLSGTTTMRAVAGVATFANLAIDKAGSGYTFVAQAAGATSPPSSAVTVTPGMAAKLRFVAAPTTASAGAVFATQPVVEVEDVMGNVIVDAVNPIALAIADRSGSASGRLACDSLSVVPTAGVATFTGCHVDQPGTDYALTATSAPLATASERFAVTGPASQLVIVQQPAQTVAGDTLSPVIVAVEDAAGNIVTDSDATVSVTLNKNPKSLTGTTSQAVVAGQATFADLAITTSATEYTLTMKADGLRSTTTVVIDVLTGPGSQLVFTRQPSGGKAGKSWSTQPIVMVEDALGNPVITSADGITLSITPDTGAAGAVLTCAINPLAATAGEARFSKCSVDRSGAGYTVTASAPGFADAVSQPFRVT